MCQGLLQIKTFGTAEQVIFYTQIIFVVVRVELKGDSHLNKISWKFQHLKEAVTFPFTSGLTITRNS